MDVSFFSPSFLYGLENRGKQITHGSSGGKKVNWNVDFPPCSWFSLFFSDMEGFLDAWWVVSGRFTSFWKKGLTILGYAKPINFQKLDWYRVYGEHEYSVSDLDNYGSRREKCASKLEPISANWGDFSSLARYNTLQPTTRGVHMRMEQVFFCGKITCGWHNTYMPVI